MTTNALQLYILPAVKEVKSEIYITTQHGSFPVPGDSTEFELNVAERLLIVTNDMGTHFIDTDSISEINF